VHHDEHSPPAPALEAEAPAAPAAATAPPGPLLSSPLVRAALVTLGLDVILLVLQFGTWALSLSPAIWADAWHSASDFLISVMVLFSLALEHRLGKQGRAAYIENATAGLVAVFIMGNGLHVAFTAEDVVAYESWRLYAGLGGTLLSILAVWALARIKYRVARRYGSLSFEAEAGHSLSDLFTSIGVFFTLLLSLAGVHIERIAAVLIGLLIFRIGFVLLLRAVRNLRHKQSLQADPAHAHLLPEAWTERLRTWLPWGGRALALLRALALGMARLTWLWLLIAALAYGLAGLHSVGPGEAGLHFCFGRLRGGTLGPGLHYHAPAPFCQHLLVPVDRARRLTVGYEDNPLYDGAPAPAYLWDGSTGSGPWRSREGEALYLTGDGTIVDLELVASYRISDLRAWALESDDPEGLLRAQLRSLLTDWVGRQSLDSLLTEGRAALEDSLLAQGRAFCAARGLGIQLDFVQLRSVHPPISVVPVYRRVASAREPRQEKVDRAEGFANDLLPRSRGKAAGIGTSAERYQSRTLAHATGRAEAFAARQESFARHAPVERLRLGLEASGRALAKVAHLFLVPQRAGGQRLYLGPSAAGAPAPAAQARGAAARLPWVEAATEPRRSPQGDPYPENEAYEEDVPDDPPESQESPDSPGR